jgi:hypothetical protein
MARPPRASLLVAALLLTLPACQRDEESPTSVTPRRELSRERADALLEDPSPTTLLAALAQPHRDVRQHVGPHRLHYTGEYALVPVEEPGRPKIGEPVLEGREVADELTLEWGSAVGEPLAFRLVQKSDHDDSRHVLVLDERIYTHLEHRGWFWRELDSELHEQWLDDAVHCMHDAVALAAPRLSVTVGEGEEDTMLATLSLADGVDPDLIQSEAVSGPGAAWRHQATIESVSGQIVLDRNDGSWRSGEVEIGYTLADRLGRKVRGRLHVEGRLEPVEPGDLEITPPEGAEPVPERERYEVERGKLLDGLAAP